MIHIHWWQLWQMNIRCAKAFPNEAIHFCREAMYAQGQYIMHSAIYFAEATKFKNMP